ncbi:uncharacterized protein LOC127258455 isoform X2 [Andrographis paniculata]|uniref:uncharacterized protein LOC127258455 isoform X2 n=1 Tax=Andrographis paniculata TaxID=175694 RepID=UPI0021E82C4A|nr:uncharacterized protein LOC127258455 isoform X2 [Andrographis paniculata]
MAIAGDSSGGGVVTSPGKTLAGDQIEDSKAKGPKSCHQCRQKIKKFAAACKSYRKNKPCTLRICKQCLLNRYGEIAEEAAMVENWSCPKCRGICNCSVCMRRRGGSPKGAFSPSGRPSGVSSVSRNQEGLASPRRGKENSFNGHNISSKVTNHGQKRGRTKERIGNTGENGELSEKKHKKMKCDVAGELGKDNDGAAVKKNLVGQKKKRKECDSAINDEAVDIALPVGTELKHIAGVDVLAEDMGNALQFLEFCSAFGKVLEIRKGQPEHVLQDLFHGRAGRRGKYSVTIQFHNHLLSILLPENEKSAETENHGYEKSSWFRTLKEYLSESKSVLEAAGVWDSLEKAADYEALNSSEKLMVLNIVCDEILETEKVRRWMAEQVQETKEKEKSLRDKAKNPVDGDSNSTVEQLKTSADKSEVAQDHADVLKSKDILLKRKRSCNAVRTDPVLMDTRGHGYWMLNCLGSTDVQHQSIGKGDDSLSLKEEWFGVDAEGKEVIKKHVRSLRLRSRKSRVGGGKGHGNKTTQSCVD